MSLPPLPWQIILHQHKFGSGGGGGGAGLESETENGMTSLSARPQETGGWGDGGTPTDIFAGMVQLWSRWSVGEEFMGGGRGVVSGETLGDMEGPYPAPPSSKGLFLPPLFFPLPSLPCSHPHLHF